MQLNSCTWVPALNMWNSWNFWRTMTQQQPYPDISHTERQYFSGRTLHKQQVCISRMQFWKLLNNCSLGKHFFLSSQKHRQKFSHQISCFCSSCSSVCALSRNTMIHLFLFSRVIYILFLSHHKEWKSKPTIFYCLLSCSLARPLWPQPLVISGSQLHSHQKPVEKAYRCIHIVVSTIMQ